MDDETEFYNTPHVKALEWGWAVVQHWSPESLLHLPLQQYIDKSTIPCDQWYTIPIKNLSKHWSNKVSVGTLSLFIAGRNSITVGNIVFVSNPELKPHIVIQEICCFNITFSITFPKKRRLENGTNGQLADVISKRPIIACLCLLGIFPTTWGGVKLTWIA